MSAHSARAIIDNLMLDQRGRLLASLIQQFRDIELAEDVLQDAVMAALVDWPENDIPDHPLAWLMQTAKRKAIDRLRRSGNYAIKREQLAILLELENDGQDELDDQLIGDERLRLIFTCCHPALAESAQVSLTLHTLCGLSTRQVAKAFLVPEPIPRPSSCKLCLRS